ncbi:MULTISPECIES: hypothetical protein [Oceanobacillus]|nr:MULTISPECIES: hypothetical protein [Oceanobacillus]MCT1575889.1 hypothetical protein [Oceanobacillus kimchii]MCT2135526.1 hypothetical protein [Oceanobacillus kimchii]OEH55630.1 hypothetical protein AQ616_05465 [Oceanobacillus sp. E9]
MEDERKNHTEDAPHYGDDEHPSFIGHDLDSKRNEEYAQEFTADDLRDSEVPEEDANPGTFYGWAGIALALISFFVWPIILGSASIIFGFVARSRDIDVLGNIAIGLGVISMVMSLFVIPFLF